MKLKGKSAKILHFSFILAVEVVFQSNYLVTTDMTPKSQPLRRHEHSQHFWAENKTLLKSQIY